MKTLLCIHEGKSFFGKDYFDNQSLFEEAGIEAIAESVPDYSPEALAAVAEEYPEEQLDGVLVHKFRAADNLTAAAVYCDTPVYVAGHTLSPHVQTKRKWENAINSGRELYVFTGSVRAARSYYRTGSENLQVVLSPIMGRSPTSGVGRDTFIESPAKEFDIGFFSALTLKKRPHQVLEHANTVAKELGKTLRVWIAGHEFSGDYATLLDELAESDHYEHIDVTHTGRIADRDRLFELVQKSRVMYLPLAKHTETTCYSAWEVASYDIPLIASDWAGVGEATRHSRHPRSSVIPIKTHESRSDVFSKSVRDAYPELTAGSLEASDTFPIGVDSKTAVEALTEALEASTSHTRKFRIPDRVHAQSTMNAFADIMDGETLDPEELRPDQISITKDDVLKTTRGYSLLREPEKTNPLLHQTSFYQPPTN